jgi:DNA-binding MarR family transcriptional regulator
MPNHSEIARVVAETCPGLRVRRASRVLTRIYHDALRPVGVQGSQFSLLVAIARFGEPGATMGALADVQAMDRTTLTRNIGPLEKAGFLRVARDPHDARARLLLLTRKGEALLETAYPLWEEATSRIRKAVGASRLQSLRDELAIATSRLLDAPRP